jgi:threonine synthase
MVATAVQPRCSACASPYPSESTPTHCPRCGSLFEIEALPPFDRGPIDAARPGLWRYRNWLAVAEATAPLWLGEGLTPLVPATLDGARVWCKLESLNPTGSFKDRGSAVLAAWLRGRSVKHSVEDSSGNAGASFAAYCGAAAIEAHIFVPAHASGAKLKQIESYGAKLERVSGPREEAARAAREAAEAGAAYGSHALLPFGLSGIATMAFEIFETLGQVPRAVVLPAGHGTLAVGLLLGFNSLLAGSCISRLPRFILVQAQACAPVFDAWRGSGEISIPSNPTSRAEGILIRAPVHLARMLEAVNAGGGMVASVAEPDIEEGWRMLNGAGISAEPTSAVVVAGLRQALSSGRAGRDAEGPIVLIITGHSLKSM